MLNYNDLTNLAINLGIKIDGDNIYSSTTSDSRSWEYGNSNWFITLPAGTYNISLSYSKQATNVNAGIGVYLKEKSIFFTNTANVSNFNRTFTLDEESLVGIMMKVYDGIFKIQLEQGSVATTYQPYIQSKIFILNNNNIYEEFVKNSDNMLDYSIQEQKIGTWINGKPLYRKIYDGIQVNTSEIIVAETKEIIVQMIYGWFVYTPTKGIQPIGGYRAMDSASTSRVLWDGTYVKVQGNTDWQTGQFTARVVIEYTKTTD